jgi:hypothetical protein
MLEFDPNWRFDSPGELSPSIVNAFGDLIGKIAAQEGDKSQYIYETFKSYFAGGGTSWSSSDSWAQSDMDNAMTRCSKNAPVFIDAFVSACEALKKQSPALHVPSIERVNRLLAEGECDFEIRFPNIVPRSSQAIIAPPERVVSLDEQAHALIDRSLSNSSQFLDEGRYRAAVQEMLWLLETVATAFKGLESEAGTVQGKYFNKIAADLRNHHRGKMLEQVLNWVLVLHGFLSSPTGGGIRHGADLSADSDIAPHEARLMCNLIQSYVVYFLAEHEQLSVKGRGD